MKRKQKKAKQVKQAKAKKVLKLTPLQRANRKVRDAACEIQTLKTTNERQQANHEYRITRLGHEEQNLRQNIADKAATIAAKDVLLTQKNATIALRDERIADLTNERNRIVRIVDQFTSVQITSHGTELRVASDAPAAPNVLRLPVPGAVAAAMTPEKFNPPVPTPKPMPTDGSYRSSMFRS